ncbi:AMP-binding protein [Gemmata sp.]|uniref:AMP-binding protein n=1 Tax=Gemmata sp. TaxID=1914242 RepID=UPI003F71979E
MNPDTSATGLGVGVTSPAFEAIAYAIYTPGSPARPKAVLVESRGIVNLLDAQIPRSTWPPAHVRSGLVCPAFDASVSDIGTVLLSGATLCVEPDDDLRDPIRLIQLLRDRAITHVDPPPSFLGVPDPAELPATLRTVVAGGEPAGGFLVPASLYVSDAWEEGQEVAGVVGSCGHAPTGKAEPAYQSFCRGLARMGDGHVVLVSNRIASPTITSGLWVAPSHPAVSTAPVPLTSCDSLRRAIDRHRRLGHDRVLAVL